MAKYKAYPEYKETQLGWLAELPAHWGSKKLKYLGQVIIGLTYSPDDVVNEDEGTLVLRSSNVQNGRLDFSDNVYVIKKIPLQLKVKENDILICARNGSRALIGKNAKITKDAEGMAFGAFMSIFRSRYNNYLSKVFNSALFEYQSGSFLTATINQLTTSNLNSFEIPLPPKEERDHIVYFLDHETKKIDNLIEKQQQLIELLKEKRQAVISHAVTKGLNPDVPMKDSGVEWLGEVPEHWNVKKFKYLCTSIIAGPFGSSITKDMYIKNGYKVYGQEQVIPNDFNIGDYYISDGDFKKLARYSVKPGDVLISCVGTFGKIAIFPDAAERGIINPRLIKATLDTECNPDFVRELLKSDTIFKQFELLSRGGTMGVINIAILNEILTSIPPYNEQEHIFNFVKEQKIMFKGLIEKALNQIDLLQERRTALISAAVTGKIDVRDWVAPANSEMADIEESPEVNA